MKKTSRFLTHAVVVSVLAGGAGSVLAADGGDMRWSTRIEPVCGVQIRDGQGGIAFMGEDVKSADSTAFTIASNNPIANPYNNGRPSAYVKVDLDDVSPAFGGRLNANNALMTFTSDAIGNRHTFSPVSFWDGKRRENVLPAGDYSAWMKVALKRDSMPAGEASVVTTITVSCPLAS
ncbi:hypothetical protein [Spongorhabdus nitratireducens]